MNNSQFQQFWRKRKKKKKKTIIKETFTVLLTTPRNPFYWFLHLHCVDLCFMSFFFLPNSLSVSYACGLITPIQRVGSSERHCFYYDFTTILFCIFFCLFFFLFFVFSSCGIMLVFNTRCCFSIARCQNCLKNLINEILKLSCHQLSSSSLSLSDLVLKASSLKDK